MADELEREVAAVRASAAGSVGRVVALEHLRELVTLSVQSEVDLARAQGETWAGIGAGLGLSRQAAFRRYGTKKKTTKGVDMTTALMASAPERVHLLVSHLDQGRFDAARDDFDDPLATALPAERLEQVWEDLVRSVGAFEDFGEETSLVVDSNVVVEVRLRFEAGALTCRTAWAPSGRIAGLFFLPVLE
ncbi:DUF3887 domain-containing protein [Promicromonospora sp. Marseille-Q5078]